MHFSDIALFLLPLLDGVSASDHEDEASITSITSVPSSTYHIECSGESSKKWRSCSSSIDSAISKCGDEDIKCGCENASKGLSCLASLCPSHVPEICYTSYRLDEYCYLVGVSLPSIPQPPTCPSEDSGNGNQRVALNSILPTTTTTTTTGDSTVSETQGRESGMGSVPQTQSQSQSQSGRSTAVGSVPSQNGAANGTSRAVGGGQGSVGLNLFLGAGVVISVTVGGLAAFL